MRIFWAIVVSLKAITVATTQTNYEVKIVQPHEVPAYNAFNSAVMVEGSRPLEALILYRSALDLKPDLEEALLNIGSLYDRMGDTNSAFLSFETLMNLPSTTGSFRAAACNNIGHMKHKKAGRDILNLQQSVEWYKRALTFDPVHMDSMYNMGKVLQEMGEEDKAKETYLVLLEIYPDHPEARLNLSNYYFKLKDYENAALHQQLVAQSKEAPVGTRLMALNNLGNLYRDNNLHNLAEQSFTEAFAMSENTSATALSNLYVARRTLNKWEGAEQMMEDIIKLSGSELDRRKFHSEGHVALTSLEKQELSRSPSLLPYDSLLLSSASPSFRLRIASSTSMPYESVQRLYKLREGLAIGKKITVCYLSYDFRDHPMGHLTRALVLGHTKPTFRSVLLSYGANDGSKHRKSFETADKFIDANLPKPGGGMSVNTLKAAQEVHLEDVDILVDLMSHTRGGIQQIAALKPASILVNYLGFPGTSGGSYYDYAIVDRLVAPPEAAAATWSEKLIVLPHTYQANEYDLEAGICDGGGGEFCERGKMLLKGQQGGIAVCNFNNIDKVTMSAFDMWMNVIRSNSSAKMYMLRPKEPAGSVIVGNLYLEAEARGIKRSRIVFLERAAHEDHIERIGGCDLMVDTLVYGAHTTSSDFLWAGVPVFTMHGYGTEGRGGGMSGGMASRVGSSFLKNLVGEEGKRTVKDMEDEMSRLFGSSRGMEVLKSMRKDIARSVLWKPHYDNTLITKNIEMGYEIALQLRKARIENMNIVISPQTKDDDSISLYNRAISLATDALNIALQDADYTRAMRITARLVTSFGEVSPDVNHLRGLAFQGSDTSRAAEFIRRAVAMNPGEVTYRYNLGSMLSRIGDGEGAMREYVEALKLNFHDQMVSGIGGLTISLPGIDSQLAFDLVCQADGSLAELCGLAKGDTDLSRIENISGLDDDLRSSIVFFFVQMAQRVFETKTNFSHRLLKLATILNPDDGNIRLKLGAALEAMGDGTGAWREYVLAVDRIHSAERSPLPFRPPTGRPVVAIYCNEYGQTWWPNWSYSSHKRGGLGGSEESVLFLAREVANLGYTVVVYNEVLEEEEGKDPENSNVFWTLWKKYDIDNPPDIFVAWRYHLSLAVAGVGRDDRRKPLKTFLWLQDAVTTSSYTQEMCGSIDNIFVLSSFHSRILPSYCSHKVTPNGIDVEKYFREGGDGDGTNDSGVMAYGSAPNRGLEVLLDMWGDIQRLLMERGIFEGGGPTLNIYYGFSMSFLNFGRSGKTGLTESEFDAWVDGMKNKMESLPGVNYIGMVPHDQLTREYAASGFILYPTVYPETGCVTLMKAMSAGAIPVTSRFRDSTLPELTGDYDLGPEGGMRDGMKEEERKEWRRNYVERVVEVVEKGRRGEYEEKRMKMKSSSRTRFSWTNVAMLWAEEFVL